MELLLTEEQTLLRDAAAKLFARVAGPAKLRSLRDSETGFDRVGWREIAEAGFLSMLVAEDNGGAGLGATELCLVMEQAGAALCTLPIGFAAATAPHAPESIGNKLILPAIDRLMPFAALADGIFLGGGPLRLPVQPVSTLRLVDGSAVSETGWEIDPGFDIVLFLALVSQGAELVGIMDRAFAIALDYLKTRVQFDKKIGSFQALQHRAVDEYMEVEITRSLVYQVAAAQDRGTAYYAMAFAVKARAAAAALRVCKTAMQFHGAMGYTDEHDIGLYLKRAMAVAALLGNEAANRHRFAAFAGLKPLEELIALNKKQWGRGTAVRRE